MSGYNSQVAMPDFFMNERLKGIFPQFTNNDINITSDQLLNENTIKNKVTDYLVAALKAERTTSGITVMGEFDATVAKVRALATVCEGIFSSSQSVVNNIKTKSKVYTTVSTITQLADLQTITQKIDVMNQVLDNINYNKDFNSLASVDMLERANQQATFERRQKLWENKVGYKQDPRLARMNQSTKWHR